MGNFSAKSKGLALSITEPPRRVSPVRATGGRAGPRQAAAVWSTCGGRCASVHGVAVPGPQPATPSLRVSAGARAPPRRQAGAGPRRARAGRARRGREAPGEAVPRPRGAPLPRRCPRRGLPQDRRVSLPRTPGVTVAAAPDRAAGSSAATAAHGIPPPNAAAQLKPWAIAMPREPLYANDPAGLNGIRCDCSQATQNLMCGK